MKLFALLGAALMAAVVTSAAQAQDTIKIGVITDRIGVSKPYSEPSTEGLIFGANEINKKGGILGKKIELLIEDDQSRPDISAALARKLIDGGEDAADDADEFRRHADDAAAESVFLADGSLGLDPDCHAPRTRTREEPE